MLQVNLAACNLTYLYEYMGDGQSVVKGMALAGADGQPLVHMRNQTEKNGNVNWARKIRLNIRLLNEAHIKTLVYPDPGEGFSGKVYKLNWIQQSSLDDTKHNWKTFILVMVCCVCCISYFVSYARL